MIRVDSSIERRCIARKTAASGFSNMLPSLASRLDALPRTSMTPEDVQQVTDLQITLGHVAALVEAIIKTPILSVIDIDVTGRTLEIVEGTIRSVESALQAAESQVGQAAVNGNVAIAR